MRIGLHGIDFQLKSSQYVQQLLSLLTSNGAEMWVTSKFHNGFKFKHNFDINTFDRGDNLEGLDFFISLGGDGTLLDSVTYIGRNETPILGVNMGRMGFLATTAKDEVEKALTDIMAGNYKIERRTMLKLISDPPLFDGISFALNDFTIMKNDTSSMIKVHVFVDEELLNTYWADGIIVSTPTGSTGYSLSCGGPLVFPESDSLVVTPISPHNLGARPIVVSHNSTLKFKIEGRTKNFLISLDSRFERVNEEVKLEIVKESFKAHLIQLPDQHYFKTLRQKLNWGLDIRN